jgi:hypothetical protein
LLAAGSPQHYASLGTVFKHFESDYARMSELLVFAVALKDRLKPFNVFFGPCERQRNNAGRWLFVDFLS